MSADLLRRAADKIDGAQVKWEVGLAPDYAAPLAAWLRGHADYCDAVPVAPEPHALALARTILGQES